MLCLLEVRIACNALACSSCCHLLGTLDEVHVPTLKSHKPLGSRGLAVPEGYLYVITENPLVQLTCTAPGGTVNNPRRVQVLPSPLVHLQVLDTSTNVVGIQGI